MATIIRKREFWLRAAIRSQKQWRVTSDEWRVASEEKSRFLASLGMTIAASAHLIAG
jgi:hypothetical protein